MPTLRPSRPARVWGAFALSASCLVLAASAASAATANPGTVTVTTGKKDPAASALRKAKVKVSAVRPASVKGSRWTMPVAGTPALDATSIDLSGRLKFARGKRNVTFTSLRVTLGKKPAVSGTVGKRRVTILTLSGSPKRDASAGTISLKNTKASLNSAAVRILRSKLSTSRIKAGRLGKATVTVRVKAAAPGPVAPVPQPQPTVPTPPVLGVPIDPGGMPDPGPEPVCWAPTPTGTTDWIGCGTQTGGNLRSWTSYIKVGGSVTPTGGAMATPSGTGFDHRFSVASTDVDPVSKTVTIAHTGGIAFFKSYEPAGYLDVKVENLRFVVSADRASADVFVDATYNLFEDPTTPAAPHPNVNAMTVDLTAALSTTLVGTDITYERAPAKLTAEGRAVWDSRYEEGAAFGAFTITVPAPVG